MRLSNNEAALILCILGTPDPRYPNTKRLYPSVEESLNYMKTGNLRLKQEDGMVPVEEKQEESVQLSLF